MLDTGRLNRITTFPALIEYLRDQLDWPIAEENFEDLTYDWDPAEFGLSTEAVGQIEIKQLRPIEREPWGIFFLSLPQKKLPITVLRRILGGLAVKKRASANAAERAAWNKDDLFFIAAHGAGDERSLAFAHFHEDKEHGDLPSLKVLGWDEGDTIRRLSDTHRTLKEKLHWRDRGEDDSHWRSRWNEAFREKPGESIATSKALAKELADLAREIRRRANELLEEESEKGPLRTLHKAFKEALIHDLKFDDFADMYAQTIAYGLLAARISRESGALVSDNAADLAPPTNPFLKELLQTFLSAGGRKGGMDFDELGVNDVVEMLRRADMHAVLLDFDTKNPSEDPVIHFYELFLKEYDAHKRMQRGVFYTPRPVVSFIVRSVDEALRTEFGLDDGLASTATWTEVIATKPEIKLPNGAAENDPFVRILDPATGTGTFLVEVVDLIHGRMTEGWRKAGNSVKEIEELWNDYVPKHLLPRLYGFELMMAPYAIAHMKLGLKLAETGYHFRSDERARIYLTNALEPAQDFDMQLAFMSEALAHEAEAANRAKEVRFTAVIGNPPYAGNSANPSRNSAGKLTWIGELIQRYFTFAGAPLGERNPRWLNNDYVKFIRFSQFIAERTGVATVGLITSHSWLDSATFRGMRESTLQTFRDLRIVDCHGNVKKAAFAGDQGLFEIEEGTAIFVGIVGLSTLTIRHFDLIGRFGEKIDWLLKSTTRSTELQPLDPFGRMLNLRPPSTAEAAEYETFPSIREILTASSLGLVTHRDSFVFALDGDEVRRRLKDFASENDTSFERIVTEFGLHSNRDWSLERARKAVRPRLGQPLDICDFRPFDRRATMIGPEIMDYPRNLLMENVVGKDNVVLNLSRQQNKPGFRHALCSKYAAESCYISAGTKEQNYGFVLWSYGGGTAAARTPNVAAAFVRALTQLSGLTWDDCVDAPKQSQLTGIVAKKPEQTAMFAKSRVRGDLEKTFGPRDVFDWVYAVLHSPTYRSRYVDYLKSDFARVPLPGGKSLFQEVVPLGTKLVALHLLDVDAAPELKDPQSVRLAGTGGTSVEQKPEWLAAGGNRVSISNHRWFEGVPERVWSFHIGGYQPAQKWLKDRAAKGGKNASSGRVLTAEDQLHYRRMIVAIDKTIDVMAEIDRVIEKHGGWPAAFKGMRAGERG